MPVFVNSEIGKLKRVVLHTPGDEIENMTPSNAERALYSDILNLSVALEEYEQFKGILDKYAQTFEIRDLLIDVLSIEEAKNDLIKSICMNEKVENIKEVLFEMENTELCRQLIEGVPLIKDNLTKFLSEERYSLRPLHNFFFTRDSGVTINDKMLISKLKSTIREREALIVKNIFNYHPLMKTETVEPEKYKKITGNITIEGGDVLVVRDDVLLIGTGIRTSTYGIDFILECLKEDKKDKHLIIQELPHSPESFIHLDMVFTILDYDKCMIYEPVVFSKHAYQTIHIHTSNGKVNYIREEEDILKALKKLNIDLEPIQCGGEGDIWIQEREQWHSGANFFALEPGKVIGYGRNEYTIEELVKHGFKELYALDILEGNETIENYDKCIVTIDGSELSRGGGGCRCMTMPVERESLSLGA